MAKTNPKTPKGRARRSVDPDSPWIDLLKQLEAIYKSAKPADEHAISAYSDGKPGLEFPDSAFDEIAAWLHAAYAFAQQRQNASFIARLEDLLADYTRPRLTILKADIIADKGWIAFGRPERVRSKSAPKGEVFIDGIDAMYLFQCFLEDLLDNVRFEASVPPPPPPERSNYWSPAQLGLFLDRDKRTVENWMTQFRQQHDGRLPPWATAFPPESKKGWRVIKSRFLEFYEGGFVQGLGKRDRARLP